MLSQPANDWDEPDLPAPWLPTAIVLSSGLWGVIIGVARYIAP